MIDANHLFLAVLVLILFGHFLAFIIGSKRFWVATDYLWYALAALSVGLFVSDLNDRLKNEDISNQSSEVERQADAIIRYFELIKSRSVCLMPETSCVRVSNAIENLTEFQASANWPFGDFEDKLEVNYPSLPAYLNEISPEFLESSPSSFQDLPQITATLTAAIADLDKLNERETWEVSVAIMRFAVYLFAMGIALKIGKVTWTLRQFD